MKTYNFHLKGMLIACFIILSMSSYSLLPQGVPSNFEPTKYENFYKLQSERNKFYEAIPYDERRGFKQFKRWEHFWAPRVYPTGQFPDAFDIMNEWQDYKKLNKDVYNNTLSNSWRLIGPIDRPTSANPSVRDQGIGRVNIIRWHKDSPNDLWVGAATGGVWRSKDAGKNWSKFPFTQFLSLGVSDIQIAPSNPNVVYVATGDMDGSTAAQNYYGIGIIKTTDQGATWSVTNAAHELEERKLFGKMFISPTDHNVVVATSNYGMLKTTNGGDSWSVNQNGFFIDMEAMPTNSNILYASTFSYSGIGEIYKSTDMGNTWRRVHQISNCIRIAIEVTPANPDLIYAIAVERSTNGFHSFWLSEDQGETWDVNFTKDSGINLMGWQSNGRDLDKGQGHFDLALAVSPLNPRLIFVGGVNIWKSTNSGISWTISAHWYGHNAPLVHADQHDLKFTDDGKILYACHDGGIDYTTNGGTTWLNISDGLSITQYYRIGSTEADPNLIIAGAQDNGTSMFKDGRWIHVLGGDGMDCAIDPFDANRIYGSLYYGDFRRSTNGGVTFNNMLTRNETNENGAWVAPIHLDPQSPNIIYTGYQNVWRSNAYGNSGTWSRLSNFGSSATLQNIAVAPTDSRVIYASSLILLYASYDNGATWKTILNSDLAISDIAVSNLDPNVVYITKSGYQRGNKVWKYDGEKWRNLSGNLPNVPANTIIYQKNSPDRIYIGTDIGVFYSDYGSNIWELYGSGLPNLVVNDLNIIHSTNTLRAGTWGRGVWGTSLLNCNLPKPQISAIGETRFCQGDSVVIVANVDVGNVSWNTGETSKQVTVKQDGDYSFVVTTGEGCNAKSDIITVVVSPVPELTLSMDKSTSLCNGDSLVINARPGFGTTYVWNNGVTGRRLVVYEDGEYYCMAVTGDGCETVSEIVKVTFHPSPEKPTIVEEFEFLVSSPASKYQWYFNGAAISGANEQRYRPKEVGKYTVAVSNSGDCFVISDEYDLLVGVKEEWTQDTRNILLSPNPTLNDFNIQTMVKSGVRATITVTNLSGREVARFNEVAGSNGISRRIDLSGHPAGTYIITVSTPNYSFSERIIKQ